MSVVTTDTDDSGKTFTCSATSAGGTTTKSVTIYRDAAAPTTDPADDVNDTTWRNTPLEQDFTASDPTPGSGLANSADANFTLQAASESEDAQTPSTDSKTISDVAGNSVTRTLSAFIDLTNPTISGAAAPAANSYGWNNGDVSVTYTCDDALSGVASCSSPTTLSSDGANQSAQGTATDNAGNTDSATVSDINIDKTKPTVSVNGFTDGKQFTLADTLPTATCDASDSLSGLASTPSPVKTADTRTSSTNNTGKVTYKCEATDKAGNTASDTKSFYVVYKFDGFRQPVDNPGTGATPVYNQTKAGQAIPIKFSLFGNKGLSIVDPNPPKLTQVTCPKQMSLDAIEETSASSNSGLTYDATADQYNYVWKTASTYAGKCYMIDIKLNDGTSHQAYFNFTK